jgi:hypothetical protein
MICHLLRKPLEGGNIENVSTYGVGGINLDRCRVPIGGERVYTTVGRGFARLHEIEVADGYAHSINPALERDNVKGRHPANILLAPLGMIEIDRQSGPFKTGAWCRQTDGAHPFGDAKGSPYERTEMPREDVTLGVSRVFWRIG